MNFQISFVIFIFVLFIYIHLNEQYKKSQDLEIYELEYKGIENLQETCDIKQPVVFNFMPMIQKYAPINLDVLSSVEKEDGNILILKDTADFFNDDNTIIPTEVPLSFHSTIQLIKTDNSNTPHFFTENNHEFIEETGIDNVMIKIGDAFLKPNYTINQKFDIMTAGKGVGLPLRYHTYTRKYIYVASGRIVVKMTPFKNIKKLDFNNRLISPINCWNPQSKYISKINKIRFLEFDVLKGNVLYIPPFWVYSILYAESDTCLLEYNYQTIMNIVAHPQEVIHSIKTVVRSLIDSISSNKKQNSKYNNDNDDDDDDDDDKHTDNKSEEDSESISENTESSTNKPYDLHAIISSHQTTTP